MRELTRRVAGIAGIAGLGGLAACSVLQAPYPFAYSLPDALAKPQVDTKAGTQPEQQADALAALQRACIAAPGDALAWQRLGEQLLAQGDGERGARMLKQAHSLREHTLAGDYATLNAAATATPAAAAASASASARRRPWPAGMARTELRVLGPALLELRRVPPGAVLNAQGDTERSFERSTVGSKAGGGVAGDVTNGESGTQPPVGGAAAAKRATGAAVAAEARAAGTAGTAGAAPHGVLRLEISNGNGVRGLAAVWGRTLHGGEFAVIRLSNIRPFAERTSRIEYRAASAQQARHLAARIGVTAVEGDTQARRGHPDLRLVLGRDLRPSR